MVAVSRLIGHPAWDSLFLVITGWRESRLSVHELSFEMMLLRISTSPRWLEDMRPLARMKPARPAGGARLRRLTPTLSAFEAVREKSRKRLPPQSLMLKGGLFDFGF